MDKFKKLIKTRIDRFNRLWNDALGYSFEDEPTIENDRYTKEMDTWKPKADELAKKYGFESIADYENKKWESHYSSDENEINIDVLDDILKMKPTAPNALYDYEMIVINEAERIARFITRKSKERNEDIRTVWNSYAKENDEWVDNFKFVQNIKKDGYKKWDDGHSGNSAGMALMFANCMLFRPDIFPYLHGALAPLVGDEGYHDDRKDVPKFNEN